MPNGRPTWCRRTPLRCALGFAALTASLAAGAGCQRLPLRHTEVDPVATSRPTTLVDTATAGSDHPGEAPPHHAAPLAIAPALASQEVVEPEALGSESGAASKAGAITVSRPTPLLDAALARAEGFRTETPAPAPVPEETPVETPAVAEPPAKSAPAPAPVAVETPASSEEPKPAPQPAPDKTPAQGGEQKPADESAKAEAPAAPKAEPPAEKTEPVAATKPSDPLATTAAPSKPIDPEKPVEPVVNRDEWGSGLGRLRELALRRAGEPGDAAEAWAIRARVLDWLAGEGDDPRDESRRVWNNVLAALSTATSAETVDATALSHHLGAAVETLESYAPLRIRVLSLCRKVQGFGQYEPLDGPTVRSGQSLWVYCEMEGLKYEGANDDYRSRLSSQVEVVPAAGGAPVWSKALGTAEDHCRRRRRDYYVNYQLALPSTVAPGPYTLRLTQTDLLSGASVSSSTDFTITP